MADRTQTRRRGYRRNYQACEACKKQKGRCDLGSPDNPQPPCTRCRRARKECVFGPSRFSSRGQASNSTSPAAQTSGASNPAPSSIPGFSAARQSADSFWAPQGAPQFQASTAKNNAAVSSGAHVFSGVGRDPDAVTSQSTSGDEGHLRDQLMSASIRNPTDAMSLLSHTARYGTEDFPHPSHKHISHGKESTDDDIYCRDMAFERRFRPGFRANEYPETPDDNPRGDELTFSTWMHFRLCKDKVISPNETLFLVNFFFEHMNPVCQILSDYYRDPKNHLELLRDEPTLACSIVCVAARYCRLPGHAALSRGMLVHNTLFRYIQQCITRVVWGLGDEEIGVGSSISFIESLLIFINWHPRTLQMMVESTELALPTDFETAAHGKFFFENSVRGIHAHVITRLCRQSNKMTWMLVGIMSTLALEIGLFEPDAIPGVISTRLDERKLRIKKLILLNCVEAHYRLGKAGSLQQPFGLSFDIQPPGAAINLDENSKFVHRSLDCGLEIAQLTHMATTSLYQNPAQTKSMITSRKYVNTVTHFDALFQNWHNKAQAIPSPIPTFTALTEIMLNSARAHVHVIAIQAIMERSLPLSYRKGEPEQPRIFDESITAEVMNLPETARDLELIKVIASGCRRTMEIVIDLHRRDTFRIVTETIRQHVISSVVFALKVAGLNIEPKSDMIHLLKEVVHIIEVSAIDDLDLGPIYADTLRTLITKVEHARPVRAKPAGQSTDRPSAEEQQNSASTTSGNYPTSANVRSPSHNLATTPSSSSKATSSMTVSAESALTPAMTNTDDPAANVASFGCPATNGGNFDDPMVTTGMDTDIVGGEPADWSQWLAFQFDPSFSAFEMGYMVDATNPFV